MLMVGGGIVVFVVVVLVAFGSRSKPEYEDWIVVGAAAPEDVCPCCKKEFSTEMTSLLQFVKDERNKPPCGVLMRPDDTYFPGKVICMSCYQKGVEARLVKFEVVLKRLRDPNK